MTESVRKRSSKWDVAAEPQVPNLLGHAQTMPEIANDSTKGNASNLEWNSLEHESNISSFLSARKPNSIMMNHASSEADDSKWSQQEDSSTRIHNERPQTFQLPRQSVMEVHREDDTKQSSEVQLFGEQAAAIDEDLGGVRDKREQSPDQSYGACLSSGLDAGKQPSPTVSPKKTWGSLGTLHGAYEVPLSGEQAAAKDEDLSRVRDKSEQSPDQSYGACLSSGLDAGKQPSPTDSPKKTWGSLGRSHGSRSRSRSKSRSRSRSQSRRQSPSYSHRRGPDRSRSKSRSRSRSHSRRQSPSDSHRRGPDRLRSRSPSYGSGRGHGLERWNDRGRMGAGGLVPCRDFSVGRCRSGSECRFRHEEIDWKQSGRHHDSAVTAKEDRESRFDRGRYSASDSREKIDYSRDKFSRNDRPPVKCFDFIKGRCQRGSECRYAHHEASSDWGRNMRDENRERSHDRRDGDSSFDRRLDPPRRVFGALPCKFFAFGRCNYGENCRFSHQGIVRHDDRSGHSMGIDSNNSSWNGLNRSDHASATDTANSSRWKNSDDSLKGEDSGSKTQRSQSQVRENEAHDASNIMLTVASIPGQSFGQGVQSESAVPQPTQTHNFPASVQIQQLVPPMPLNVQMQPTIFPLPQNMQNQFIAPATSNFNVGMQNLAVLPPPLIGQGPQNYNLPLPHSGQMQLNYNLNAQIQPEPPLPPHHGLNQQNLNFGGQSQNALLPPQTGQIQSVSLQPPTSSQSVNSNEQFFDPNGQQMQRGDASIGQPSLVVSDNSITQKVVTSEQLAKITNLSASLAQFFGSASAINPQVAAGVVPVQPNEGSVIQQHPHPISNSIEPVKPDDNNLPLGYVEKDPVSKETHNNVESSTPSLATVGVHDSNPPSKSVVLEEKVQQGVVNNVPKEENKVETGRDQKEHAGDVDTDPRIDGESKQSKDVKVMRIFKSALVDFVKDVLKPSWKEGHLSKEAHKTIVKKVVEKVTGAMQVTNIPQTPEKIDIYLSHCRVKLTKLVQAYIEKYVKG